MKKVLSILLAICLCASFTIVAFAEETTTAEATTEAATAETTTEATTAEATTVEATTEFDVDANMEKLKEEFKELIEEAYKLGGDVLVNAGAVELGVIISQICADISEQTGIDMEFIEEKIMEYLKEAGLENLLVITPDMIDSLIDSIFDALKDAGADIDALYALLKDSKLVNWFASIYVGDETTTEDTSEEETTNEEITQTGQATTIGAFAVLALAGAAAFVATKKKKD